MIKNAVKKYTGLNIDGVVTLETDLVAGITVASAAKTLTADEAKCSIFEVTTGHASNCIVIPTALAVPGKLYIVANADASNAVLIKVGTGTAVTIAASKTAIVRVNSAGTAVLRVTADA